MSKDIVLKIENGKIIIDEETIIEEIKYENIIIKGDIRGTEK